LTASPGSCRNGNNPRQARRGEFLGGIVLIGLGAAII
jgi:hypothetical protein